MREWRISWNYGNVTHIIPNEHFDDKLLIYNMIIKYMYSNFLDRLLDRHFSNAPHQEHVGRGGGKVRQEKK